MCPAAGQGALGIEIREGDVEMRKHLAFLNDPDSRAATVCERALLNKLGGGCQVPIGAFAEMKDGKLHLTGVVARPDGSEVLREQQSGSDPVALGELVGETLLRRGGDKILEAVYGADRSSSATAREPMTTDKPLSGCRVLVSRARKQAGALSSTLKRWAARSSRFRSSRSASRRRIKPLDTALKNLASYDWLILTSVNGVEAMFERMAKRKARQVGAGAPEDRGDWSGDEGGDREAWIRSDSDSEGVRC